MQKKGGCEKGKKSKPSGEPDDADGDLDKPVPLVDDIDSNSMRSSSSSDLSPTDVLQIATAAPPTTGSKGDLLSNQTLLNHRVSPL